MSSSQNVLSAFLYPRYTRLYGTIQSNITQRVVLKDLIMGSHIVHICRAPSYATSAPLAITPGNHNPTSLSFPLVEAEV